MNNGLNSNAQIPSIGVNSGSGNSPAPILGGGSGGNNGGRNVEGERIPAGGCGLCYGLQGGVGPRDAGSAAHILIQEVFLRTYPAGSKEVPISSAHGRGVLDLAVYIPSEQKIEIGEIKPANGSGIAAGVTQMILYETILSEMLPNVRVSYLTRIIPSPIPFPTLSPNCPTQSLMVLPPVAGLYGYLCNPTYSQLLQQGCNCRRSDDRREREPVRARRPLTNQDIAALILLILALLAALALFFAPEPVVTKVLGIAGAVFALSGLLLFFNQHDIRSPEDVA